MKTEKYTLPTFFDEKQRPFLLQVRGTLLPVMPRYSHADFNGTHQHLNYAVEIYGEPERSRALTVTDLSEEDYQAQPGRKCPYLYLFPWIRPGSAASDLQVKVYQELEEDKKLCFGFDGPELDCVDSKLAVKDYIDWLVTTRLGADHYLLSQDARTTVNVQLSVHGLPDWITVNEREGSLIWCTFNDGEHGGHWLFMGDDCNFHE